MNGQPLPSEHRREGWLLLNQNPAEDEPPSGEKPSPIGGGQVPVGLAEKVGQNQRIGSLDDIGGGTQPDVHAVRYPVSGSVGLSRGHRIRVRIDGVHVERPKLGGSDGQDAASRSDIQGSMDPVAL